jgi:diadenosine tetraphosphatase ApaH/serine/threonine PP2A family protein phosphatase
MQYGLISDIHGNLEALQAVYKEIDKIGVDEILCLGDIIGYGPDPEKCVELVRERVNIILAGNHDYAPIGLVDVTYFNTYAKRAVEWTASQITEETRKFLEERPLIHQFQNFTIVHSTPADPDAWEYILSIDDAIENFPHFDSRCCFIGHSHVPVIISKAPDEHIKVKRVEKMTLEEGFKYIINIGSVGQPRDLDPRAAFAVFDDETYSYTLHRVKYDIGKVQRKILERGLPPFLAERLALGQ